MTLDRNPNLYLAVLRKSYPTYSVQSDNVLIHNSKSRYSILPLFTLGRLIREKQIRLLHCHLFRAQVYGFLLKKFLAPDLILVHHERGFIYGSDSKWGFDQAAYRMFMKISNSAVSGYVAISNAVKTEMISQFKIHPDKISVIRNFVDLSTFSSEKRERIRRVAEERLMVPLTPRKFIIGFAGRLTPDKGVRVILDIARNLKSQPDIHFLIVGDGPLRQELISALSRFQLDNVTYTGYCDKMDIFYSSIDLLVMPSLREAAGNCQYEAMAMGVPALVSSLPALVESVPFNRKVCTFEPGSEDDLLAKIHVFKDNPSHYKEISRKGTDFVAGLTHSSYFTKIHQLESDLISSY